MTLMTSERGLMTNVRAEIHDTQFRRIAVNGEYRDRDLIKSVPGAMMTCLIMLVFIAFAVQRM